VHPVIVPQIRCNKKSTHTYIQMLVLFGAVCKLGGITEKLHMSSARPKQLPVRKYGLRDADATPTASRHKTPPPSLPQCTHSFCFATVSNP
jgi:hypothetical protein